jgi:hypothetical protein
LYEGVIVVVIYDLERWYKQQTNGEINVAAEINGGAAALHHGGSEVGGRK